jgi:hypothetical protein
MGPLWCYTGTMKTQQTTDTIRVGVRMPTGLHEQLVALAIAEQRSLNAQIVWLLQQATRSPDQKK